MNMKFVFLHDGYSYGGAEKMFRWLASKMFSNGYDIKVCYLYNILRYDDNIPTDTLGLKQENNFVFRNIMLFILGFIKTIKYLTKNRADVVLSFGAHSYVFLVLLKPFFKYQLVVSERGDLDKHKFKALRRFLFSKSDFCIFQTPDARIQYFNIKDDKCVIIPNKIEEPPFTWHEEVSSNLIINVGRLDKEQKRQDVLIRAFSLLPNSYSNYKLKFVGTGTDINYFKSIVNELNLEGRVEFCGFSNNIIEELKQAQIFVLSSDFEGLPNALMEALIFGIPSISTDCSPGGARFLIDSGVNGIIVPCNNPLELKNAIVKLITSKSLRNKFSIQSKLKMKDFHEDSILEKWCRVFEKL